MGAVPAHVAIILDGNGRWARSRGLPRMVGHRKGAGAIQRALRFAQNSGIRALSLFCFSRENWNRPAAEVHGLMRLLDVLLRRNEKKILAGTTRFHWLGRPDGLGEPIVRRLQNLAKETARRDSFHLALAINYSGRDDVLRACQGFCAAGAAPACWEDIARRLDTGPLPDVDLLIRTSGELRLSNFLLLQSAYAELYFTPRLWPDFDETDFQAALDDYAGRRRRFGSVGDS
ncbi:MAG: di-trans,poly-cis-decaprenylcistransferase [Puniceicoccales bacterium]|jgi:undecaprenyl diphosphate synthase|nr:di-trans,poly-cis-decaprenylcistransferase [Puniceicoccales bacterium]